MTEEKKYVGRGGWRDGGRPKSDNPMDKRIALRLTESEYEKVVTGAKKMGITISAYCKEKILK